MTGRRSFAGPRSSAFGLPTRRGRKRRPDDGKFLAKDVRAWRRLIRWARAAAKGREPGAAGELSEAARLAARAVTPPGHCHRQSPFLRLVAKGRVFATTLECARAALASDLAELADACAAVLDAPAPGPRPRADLDG